MRANCKEVIHSDYSTFFGLPVELLGMAYYAAIAIGYGVVSVFTLPTWFSLALLAATTLAFLFSLYLTFIQIAALQQFCTWCLLSAGFCLVIFLLATFGSLELVYGFLVTHLKWISMVHVLGMALGLGAATLSDILFFKFLKDFRISEKESSVLSTMSEFIWFALGIVLLSGFALYLPNAEILVEKSKFLVKMIIVGVIIVNGAALNLLVAPKLVKISFRQKHDHEKGELHRTRKLAFILGPISIISWYSAFILGSLRDVPMSFTHILVIYVIVLCVGIILGQVFERFVTHKTISRQA